MNAMKKLIFLLLGLALAAGCSKTEANRSKEFTHTGCANDTRAAGTRASDFEDEPSLLTLKYEDGGLRVTRTNAWMNCSIKNGGIGCDVSIKGNVITYNVYEKDGPLTNCICPVKEMSSLVTGLEEGKEYTLNYCYYSTITFTFKKGFHQIIDLDAE
jgi:hypothetical protein